MIECIDNIATTHVTLFHSYHLVARDCKRGVIHSMRQLQNLSSLLFSLSSFLYLSLLHSPYISYFCLVFVTGSIFGEKALAADEMSPHTLIATMDTVCFTLTR